MNCLTILNINKLENKASIIKISYVNYLNWNILFLLMYHTKFNFKKL